MVATGINLLLRSKTKWSDKEFLIRKKTVGIYKVLHKTIIAVNIFLFLISLIFLNMIRNTITDGRMVVY